MELQRRGNQEWAEFGGKQVSYLFGPLTEANTNVGLDYVLEVMIRPQQTVAR